MWTLKFTSGRKRQSELLCCLKAAKNIWISPSRIWSLYHPGRLRGKHARNVYAKTREECERLLANLIQQLKAQIAAEKEPLRLEEKAG